ncbi:histidine phosphatase superfamily [Stachybotrys elegans]|uniref:Histidine phosphatase superfamily n=1 Tax=Stachybotrys elegans TaxID=80388 RepID=A0A8K0SX02_9HYPO|nr:histidine phosphatase superfamily [Stachybotrys elegans]
MAPQIVLIRHAQALHNVSNKSPSLSEEGLEQCVTLRQNLLDRFSSVKNAAIVVSPMRRTLQTACLSLDWLIERGAKIEANADWQETSAKPCDTGSPAEAMAKEFPQVDFSSLDKVWPDKTSPQGQRYAYTKQAILGRGRLGISDLVNRSEDVIFVVSHSGFMRVGVVGWWFFNSDYRIFTFAEGTDEPLKRLHQSDETIKGGLGLSWDEEVELGTGLPDPEAEAASASEI